MRHETPTHISLSNIVIGLHDSKIEKQQFFFNNQRIEQISLRKY